MEAGFAQEARGDESIPTVSPFARDNDNVLTWCAFDEGIGHATTRVLHQVSGGDPRLHRCSIERLYLRCAHHVHHLDDDLNKERATVHAKDKQRAIALTTFIVLPLFLLSD